VAKNPVGFCFVGSAFYGHFRVVFLDGRNL
jgi:hypothetical protein